MGAGSSTTAGMQPEAGSSKPSTTAGVQPEAGSSNPSTMAEVQPEASAPMQLARTKVNHRFCVQTVVLAPCNRAATTTSQNAVVSKIFEASRYPHAHFD